MYRAILIYPTRRGSNYPFRGHWKVDDTSGVASGNPANSAQVQDLMKALRHKLSAEGARQAHSAPMTIQYMANVYQFIHARLTKIGTPKTVEEQAEMMEGLFYLAFSTF